MNKNEKPKGKIETRCCIDLGSSYFRKLSVEVETGPDGPRLVNPSQERVYSGWGAELAANGSISKETSGRAADLLVSLAGDMAGRSGVRITVVATNTLRAASNRDEVRTILEERSGMRIDVLSERGESFLGFAGATSDLPAGARVLLADPGGTSTELSWGAAPVASGFLSIPVGTHTADVADLGLPGFIADAIEKSECPRGDSHLPDSEESHTIMFTGGTAVSLAVAWNQMNGRQYGGVLPDVISAEELEETLGWLGSLFSSGAERSLALAPERIILLPRGSAIVRALVEALRAKRITITARDLRWGVVLGEGITERGYLADEQESPDSR